MPIRDDSAGSYGTWNNDELSWLDYLTAKASDGGNALANLGRNLVDGFSPIGTSEQGNMALQVPPMVTALKDSASRLVGTPSHPGNLYGLTGVPEFDKPIQDDMTNLQLAFYWGNALNPLAVKPRGALGAGAMKEAASLPMDHASRMARAREMGFDVDTPLYHGTIHDFDSFDPTLNGKYNEPHGDAVHFSSNPNWSNGYADLAGHINRGRNYYDAEDARIAANKTKWPWQRDNKETPVPEIVPSENGMVYKTFIRPGKQFDVEHWTSGFDDLAAAEAGRRSDTWSVHDAVKHARENGYDSVRVRNVTSELGIGSRIADRADELVVFDPSNIRSVNAAFDPARAGENGLLLSDTGKPSILGSALATAGENYDLPPWLQF